MRRQGRCRLVEDQEAWPAIEGLGDLDHLAAPEWQILDRSRQRLVKADEAAGRCATFGQLAIVDEPEAERIGAETDILADRQFACETELLLDDGDPGAARHCR